MLSLCYIVTPKNETFDLLKLLKAHNMYVFLLPRITGNTISKTLVNDS